MRTAIVSDLHLGSATGEDLGSDAEIRQILFEEIASADRLVLLGDVLELRDLPLARVLAVVQPFFEELGKAMAGRRIVLVPGNHDHRLAEPLLEEISLGGSGLGLEHRALPAAGPTTRIAAWLGDAELSIAYPGVWLRDDVYATHGQYMDCHMSLPRLECLAAAAIMRTGGAPPEAATPADYERVLRPIYGFFFGFAEAGLASSPFRPSERAWRVISSRRRNGNRAKQAATKTAIAAGIPAGVWLLNRVLQGEFEADISVGAITRSSIAAATEMSRRLGVEASHVITGHTHLAGPEENEAAWRLPGGGMLHGSGSWVFADAMHRPGTPPGPYWPGTVTWLDDEGPPQRKRLLLSHSHEELRAAVSRATRR
jgi:hypothetical protein